MAKIKKKKRRIIIVSLSKGNDVSKAVTKTLSPSMLETALKGLNTLTALSPLKFTYELLFVSKNRITK